MNRIKTVALLSAIAVSSACVPSKYAVVAPPSEDHQQIAIGDTPLIAIKKDGSWLWRKSPEEVVQRLISFAGDVQVNCQKELDKLRPASKAKKAAKDAPVKP